jgi:hypothetical protein
METNHELPENLRQLAEKHFVLLKARNIKKKRDSLSLHLSGYADVAYLMADIAKVCILALGGDNDGHAHIPEPEVNISGVLSILLDLVPYEEFELLDHIRQGVLQPVEVDWDFMFETITVTPAWVGL